MMDNEQLKCTKYNLGKCRHTDKFFRTLATLILWNEIQILGFPCCSTLEDLSIDASIINVAITDIDEVKVISACQHK